MDRAIGQLQLKFLSPEQIAASRAIMGIDSQLIRDGTYFIVEEDGPDPSNKSVAGCGGWSRRATLNGGDHSKESREPRLLEPATEPARIRAMYTDPAFARRGVGLLILRLCEEAAAAEAFTRDRHADATSRRESLGERGIRVNAIAPGASHRTWRRLPWTERQGADPIDAGTEAHRPADDIARVAGFLAGPTAAGSPAR